MATKIGAELKSVFLEVSSAFTVDGVIAKAGDIVEVLEEDAISLLNRGKAVLATIEDSLGLGGDNADAQDGNDDTGDAGAQAGAADVDADATVAVAVDAAAPAGESSPADTPPVGEAAPAPAADDQPAQ